MIRYIEYDKYDIGYEIESDVDGNRAIIKSITREGGDVNFNVFDKEDIKDIQFHCESDCSERVYKHYLATGEIL